jgi:hypothetical protein
MNCERAKGIGPCRGWRWNASRLLMGMLGVFLFLIQVSAARAQRLDGSLRVEVGDTSGGSVVDAKVTVTNEATGVSVSTTASSAGSYVFPNLLVGTYTITVEKTGFKKSVQKGVTVESNQVAEVKIALELGEVSAVVEVEAGADLVKTESSELSATFSTRVAADLPLNTLGGDVKELAVFAPGTTTQQGGVIGSGGSIGGTRPRFNGFSIDGVDDNKVDTNGPTQPVIQESVAEFTLLTNQFSAEYGHSAGGQFNIVTKSGTNNWHGAGWEYNRNRDFNAATNQEIATAVAAKAAGNPVTDVKNRFDYNRLGASAGGPILKDKFFVYGAYEFQNQGGAGSPGATVQTPTATGMSALMALNPDPAVVAILKQFPTVATKTGSTNVTFNGTTTAIDFGDFSGVAPSYARQHDFIVNGDLNLGKHQVRGRVLYNRLRLPQVNPVEPLSQFTGASASDARKYILTDAWTISSRVINDFRASFSRLKGPDIVTPSQFANFPNVEIDEFGSNIGPYSLAPQGYLQNVYQLVDNVSYIRGKHTFKVGIEGRNYITENNSLPRARGEWDYKTLNSFINDLVPKGANGALRGAGTGSSALNNPAVYWFVQDDWKILPRLTLNLGLRYEWSGVPRDEGLQALNAIANDPAVGLIFRKPKSDTNNFGPHIGFAWDPTGRGKWSIRGGGQIAYDVIPNNFAVNSLPPELQSEQNATLTCGLSNPPAWCASGVGFLQGGGLLQVNTPPTTTADARKLTQALIVDEVDPKVITWSLGIQHELFKNSSIEVRYVGTRSLELPVQKRLNSASAFDPSVPGGGITPLPTYLTAAAVPATVAAPASTLQNFDNFLANKLFEPLRPQGFLGNLTTDPPLGAGIYHGGSVDFMHRFTKGLYFRANYTYSKNIDNATNELFSSYVNPRRAQDGFNFAAERGRSALDIPHKFAVTWVYDFPNVHSDNRFVRGLAHNWELSGTYLAESGQPVTPLSDADANANNDIAGDRTILNPMGAGLTGTVVNAVCNAGAGGATTIVGLDANGNWDCGSKNDANIVGYVVAPAAVGTNAGTITPNARFVQAQLGAKANVGRNTVSTPGLNIWNMSLFKTLKFTERAALQFRFQSYDTFNHQNYSIGLPSNNGALDQVSNANPLNTSYIFIDSSHFLNKFILNGGSRTLELGARFSW